VILSGCWWPFTGRHNQFKESFPRELVQACSSESLPLCIGGDFNIIRNSSENNNDRFEEKWSFLFNAVIDSLDLREIEMYGRKFTWANSRRVPTFERARQGAG
jgi:hypothetical protein